MADVFQEILDAITSNDVSTVRRVLLTNSSVVLKTDQQQRTALHTAALLGRSAIATKLLDSGANFRDKTIDGRTALHMACTVAPTVGSEPASNSSSPYKNSESQLVAPVFTLKSPIRSSLSQQLPVDTTAQSSRVEVIKVLLTRGASPRDIDYNGVSALHLAALHGLTECCAILHDHGANINATDANGNLPLHEAVAGGQLSLVKLLVERGGFVNARNSLGVTPLMIAAANNRSLIVRYLINQGAAVSEKDRDGETALHKVAKEARQRKQDWVDTAMALIEAGAEPNAMDNKNVRPIHQDWICQLWEQWLPRRDQYRIDTQQRLENVINQLATRVCVLEEGLRGAKEASQATDNVLQELHISQRELADELKAVKESNLVRILGSIEELGKMVQQQQSNSDEIEGSLLNQGEQVVLLQNQIQHIAQNVENWIQALDEVSKKQDIVASDSSSMSDSIALIITDLQGQQQDVRQLHDFQTSMQTMLSGVADQVSAVETKLADHADSQKKHTDQVAQDFTAKLQDVEQNLKDSESQMSKTMSSHLEQLEQRTQKATAALQRECTEQSQSTAKQIANLSQSLDEKEKALLNKIVDTAEQQQQQFNRALELEMITVAQKQHDIASLLEQKMLAQEARAEKALADHASDNNQQLSSCLSTLQELKRAFEKNVLESEAAAKQAKEQQEQFAKIQEQLESRTSKLETDSKSHIEQLEELVKQGQKNFDEAFENTKKSHEELSRLLAETERLVIANKSQLQRSIDDNASLIHNLESQAVEDRKTTVEQLELQKKEVEKHVAELETSVQKSVADVEQRVSENSNQIHDAITSIQTNIETLDRKIEEEQSSVATRVAALEELATSNAAKAEQLVAETKTELQKVLEGSMSRLQEELAANRECTQELENQVAGQNEAVTSRLEQQKQDVEKLLAEKTAQLTTQFEQHQQAVSSQLEQQKQDFDGQIAESITMTTAQLKQQGQELEEQTEEKISALAKQFCQQTQSLQDDLVNTQDKLTIMMDERFENARKQLAALDERLDKRTSEFESEHRNAIDMMHSSLEVMVEAKGQLIDSLDKQIQQLRQQAKTSTEKIGRMDRHFEEQIQALDIKIVNQSMEAEGEIRKSQDTLEKKIASEMERSLNVADQQLKQLQLEITAWSRTMDEKFNLQQRKFEAVRESTEQQTQSLLYVEERQQRYVDTLSDHVEYMSLRVDLLESGGQGRVGRQEGATGIEIALLRQEAQAARDREAYFEQEVIRRDTIMKDMREEFSDSLKLRDKMIAALQESIESIRALANVHTGHEATPMSVATPKASRAGFALRDPVPKGSPINAAASDDDDSHTGSKHVLASASFEQRNPSRPSPRASPLPPGGSRFKAIEPHMYHDNA